MRLRIKFAKLGEGRFLSHLEVMRAFQRAVRRAGLPLALSQGFNPHPRLSFGPALAVGLESEAEYLDLELAEAVEVREVGRALSSQLPPGLEVLTLRALSPGEPTLGEAVRCAAYRVEVEGLPPAELRQGVDALLASEKAVVTRRTKDGAKEVDIRPGLYRLEVEGDAILHMLLACGPQGTVRPEEVVKALDPRLNVRHARRTGLYTGCDGKSAVPLD
ncbi:MAG TPA: radical SAM protein [Peptococcaceae bacterium]|nr:radical SAM protein [Peptococcaceae bacterium]